MEGVKIEIPTVVVLPKLMGSEGFGDGGVEAVTCYTDGESVVVGSSIDGCISFIGRKDVRAPPIPSESCLLEKVNRIDESSVLQGDDGAEEMKVEIKNSLHIEGKQKQKRSYKFSRTNSGSVKRSRIARMEVPSCGANEKSQPTKQKNSSNTKRLDKKNGKIAIRSKSDSFSFKVGLGSFNTSGGGNRFLGSYGLKSDLLNVTEGMEDISLNELLDGSYTCPRQKIFEDTKADSNESILHSVQKAVSVLMVPRPIKDQSSVEFKVFSNKKASAYSLVSSLSPSSRHENGEDNACASDLSSLNKAHNQNTKEETVPYLLDSTLHHPKHVLERLSLPPAQDLETLLLDVTKQSGVSKSNPDLRGKASQRTGLPSFPWSNVNGSHCKSIDTNKPSSSRTTCQGRWIKMGNTSNMEITARFLKDFDSIAFDSSLIPLISQPLRPLEDGNCASLSVRVPSHDHTPTMSSVPLKVPPESGCILKSKIEEEDLSPRILAAAQTLCGIARQSSKQKQNLISKITKSRKFKMKGSTIIPNGTTNNNRNIRGGKLVKEELPSKKHKLQKNKPVEEEEEEEESPLKKKPKIHKNIDDWPLKSLTWSIPRSSRTTPFNSLRKCSNTNLVNKLSTPSSSRMTLDKTRKTDSIEFNGDGSKLR